eukprot:SAG11_NODE_3495_length_2412_cov_1.966278_2_plen_43_part_01
MPIHQQVTRNMLQGIVIPYIYSDLGALRYKSKVLSYCFMEKR